MQAATGTGRDVDLDNQVFKLCQDGMRAEVEGRPAEARALFLEAWEKRGDDVEACVAAHYLARCQDDPADVLLWNREALRHADAVGDDRVAAFYPSLHVGVAMACERLGDLDGARAAFAQAEAHVGVLAADDYGNQLRAAVTDARHRLG